MLFHGISVLAMTSTGAVVAVPDAFTVYKIFIFSIVNEYALR